MKENSSLGLSSEQRAVGPGSSAASTLVQFVLEVVKRRFKVLATIFVIVFAVLAMAIFMTVPKYLATAKVKLDPTRDALAAGEQKLRPGAPDQVLVDTEVSIMQSRDIARVVASRLKLQNRAAFGSAPAADGKVQTPEARREDIVDQLLGNLKVMREKGTYLVDIAYQSRDAEQAVEIANAFAQAYIDRSLVARTGTATQQAQFLDKNLDELKRKLELSDAQYADYAAKAGVVASRAGSAGYSGTVTDQEIAPLMAQLASAESEAAASASKLASAKQQVASGGLDAVSSVLDSPVITSLRAQRAAVAETLGDSDAKYGPNHPNTIIAREQTDRIDKQIDAEARRVVASLSSESSAAAARAASLRSQISALRGEQAQNTRSSVTATSLQLRADTEREAYNRAAEQFQQVTQFSKNTMTQATIVEMATLPETPSSPNKPLFTILAFIFAGIVSGAVVTTQELFSSGLRTITDLENGLGLPFIVSIPRLPKRGASGSMNPADILVDAPVSPFAEAFRILRGSILSGQGSMAPRIISMMSTLPDEGKTTCSLSLARVLAMSGEKILIIDCDLRQAGLSDAVRNSGRIGLMEVLAQGAEPSRAIFADVTAGLDVLPIISPIFTAQDIFGHDDRMKKLLDNLRLKYDRIILDTPPLLGVADARTLAALSDASILLVRWNSTALAAIKNGLTRFDDLSNIMGTVYTMVDPGSEAIGAMYYSRKYTKYYQR